MSEDLVPPGFIRLPTPEEEAEMLRRYPPPRITLLAQMAATIYGSVGSGSGVFPGDPEGQAVYIAEVILSKIERRERERQEGGK